jgi:Arc/MetJ-type ribon-helix-helix transcriptional regulator
MKQQITVTMDEEKITQMEELLKDGLFRNKSHVLEYCLNKFLKEKAIQTS